MHGEVTVETVEEKMLRAAEILEMIDKTYWTPDEITPFPGTMPGWVVLHMKNGSRLEQRQIYEPGSPQNPISEGELFRKFQDNARGVLSSAAAGELWDQVLKLDKAAEVGASLAKFRYAG